MDLSPASTQIVTSIISILPAAAALMWAIWRSPLTELKKEVKELKDGNKDLQLEIKALKDNREVLLSEIHALREDTKVGKANDLSVAISLNEIKSSQKETRDDVRVLQQEITKVILHSRR